MKHLKKYNESLDSSKEKEFEDELMDSIYQNGKKDANGKYVLTIPEMKQVSKEMILWMNKNIK